jgi:hypothetical protein
MDNIIEKSCCRRSLFVPLHTSHFKKSECSGRSLPQYSDIDFLLADNPTLYLQLGPSNDNAVDNLSHRIARDPQNLRAHIQRLALYMRVQNEQGVYGALVDLFIALGENGISIRQRMLAQAEPHLTQQRFRFLNSVMQRGIRDTDPLPDAQLAVLSKGYIGKKHFIVENAHSSCSSNSDPRQEAIDCLIYGQVNEARRILEQAVLQEPWREDLQTELLEIYWATRDLKACQAMYERLADEFIPEHHAWIEVVERISDALGGV